jgi:hypothetical protein
MGGWFEVMKFLPEKEKVSMVEWWIQPSDIKVQITYTRFVPGRTGKDLR